MLITPAFAQGGALGGDNMLVSLLPFVLIFVIMYFLILRPQQKRVKQHAEMVKNVRRGDTVVTSGGLVGKVTKVIDDDQIEVEVAERRAGAPDALDDRRRPRQGRAGEGRERQRLIAAAIQAAIQIHVYHALEGTGNPAHDVARVLLHDSELPARTDRAVLAEVGAAPDRARPRPAGRLAHPARGRLQRGAQGEGRDRCATTCAAWCARTGSAARRRRRSAARPSNSASAKAAIARLALTKLRELSQPLGGLLSATGQRTVDVVDAGGGLIRLTPTEPAIIERIRQSVEQSIQIVERRVNELGTVEPSIQRQGVDRILVQVPGLQDPSRLKELLGKTAKLTFRLVDQTTPVDQAQQGRVPPESEILLRLAKPKAARPI